MSLEERIDALEKKLDAFIAEVNPNPLKYENGQRHKTVLEMCQQLQQDGYPPFVIEALKKSEAARVEVDTIGGQIRAHPNTMGVTLDWGDTYDFAIKNSTNLKNAAQNR